jgi:hypothetical protein
VTSFQIVIPDRDLVDLRRRLEAIRWPDAKTVDDWSQGVPLSYMQELCGYWAQGHDWRRAETRLGTNRSGVGTSLRSSSRSYSSTRSAHSFATCGEPRLA